MYKSGILKGKIDGTWPAPKYCEKKENPNLNQNFWFSLYIVSQRSSWEINQGRSDSVHKNHSTQDFTDKKILY